MAKKSSFEIKKREQWLALDESYMIPFVFYETSICLKKHGE